MLKVVRKLKVDWVLKDSAHAHITGSCSIGLSVGAVSGFITVHARLSLCPYISELPIFCYQNGLSEICRLCCVTALVFAALMALSARVRSTEITPLVDRIRSASKG